MTALSQLIESGRQYHRAGDLRRAEQVFRQVLQAQPARAEVWYWLGQVCQGLGQSAAALASYREAVRLGPGLAAAHNSLGVALAQQGDLAGAEAGFRRAAQLQPDYAHAHNNLGNVLKEQGRADEALACYREAVRLKPDNALAHNNLGNALRAQGAWDGAVEHCRQAVGLRPDFAEAHSNLGAALAGQGRREEAVACYREAVRLRPALAQAHNNLGAVLAELGRADECVAHLREAVRLQPDLASAHTNLANALNRQGRLDEALACCREALRLNPDDAGAQATLGVALAGRGELDEALTRCRRATRLAPNNPALHNDLGFVLAERGQLDEALACYDQALRIEPDFAQPRLNRALVWLLQGKLGQGWDEYEWRWRCPEHPPRPFPRPAWDGGPLGGRTILVHAEQGLGDTIHFIRYAPLVKQRGGTVLLACQRPLLRLLSGCAGIDRLLAHGDPLPPFDVHAPLLSLPRLLGTTAADIPADVPYLRADEALVQRWRVELAGLPGLKVGIAWQGDAKHYRKDRQRSVPLARFAPLAEVAGVTLVSLQKGPGSEQARQAPFPVRQLEGLDEAAPFADTAAVMACLDLVVSTDTAVPHLAGALGVPCWLALPAVPDWRWLLGRADSPWYPSLRLFRQDRPGDWDGVFRRIADELRRLARDRAAPAGVAAGAGGVSVRVEVSAGELVDKITILQIKAERIADAGKVRNVRAELAALTAARDVSLPPSAELAALAAGLRQVNEALWEVEDALRGCEREGDFGGRFVELARSVYRHNDRRAALKRRINQLLGSRFTEEKAYAPYGAEGAGQDPGPQGKP